MASPSSTQHDSQGKKRKLGDDSANPASAVPAELIRDEHVWFADGNLIVRAGPGCTSGDGPVYGFRVHSAVLAARSPVFAVMFAAPHIAGETLDGAACADLPDAWEDVRALLRYFYGSMDMRPLVIPRHGDMLAAIGGPLRLAAKYKIASVTRDLVPVLRRDWPRRYDAWVHAEKGAGLPNASINPSQRREQDPAAVIRLAMDLRLGSVLPAAFYVLSGLPIRKPLGASALDRWADGTLLTPDDVMRLTVGRERIARYLKDDLFRTVSDRFKEFSNEVHHPGEGEENNCLAGMMKWWDREHPTAEEMYSGIGPLAVLDAKVKELESEDMDDNGNLVHVCRGCRFSLADVIDVEAGDFWYTLPELFDINSLPFSDLHGFLLRG